MRSIDADALIADIKECIEAKYDNYECKQAEGLKVALSCVDNAPTIEPERKKGKWINSYKRQTCSVCKQRGYRSWSFCPNCGADMRKDGD